jgi:hypothetical protein
MSFYEVVIETWAHSTGRGAVVDQMQAGARESRYRVRAENIKEAMDIANTICIGIQQNPMVWQTPIKSIGQVEVMGGQSGEPMVRVLTERGQCYLK